MSFNKNCKTCVKTSDLYKKTEEILLADQSTADPARLVVYVFCSTGGGASSTLSPCVDPKKLGNQRQKSGCGRVNQYGGIIHCAKESTCGDKSYPRKVQRGVKGRKFVGS